jgi:hypothetical protein
MGAALAAIGVGAVIAALASRIGHFPHDAGRVLFILYPGAGGGALSRKDGYPTERTCQIGWR